MWTPLAALLVALPLQEGALDLLEVDLSAVDPARRAALVAELELDVAAISSAGRYEVVAGADERARLARAGLPHDTLIQDLAGFYAARLEQAPSSAANEGALLGQWLAPAFGQGAMGGYYTFDEVSSVLEQLRTAYPTITRLSDIGTSVQGRPLRALCISDAPGVDEGEPAVRFDALHHAREPMSMQAVLWFMLFLVEGYGVDPLATYLVDERELWFVPVVNPDGYVHNQSTNPAGGGLWRKNRRANADGSFGVDLNRNYGFKWGYDNLGSSPTPSSAIYRGSAPASEPEVAAMQAFLATHGFATALSVHTYGNEWLKPWGYDQLLPDNEPEYAEVSALATEVNGYTVGTSWQLNSVVNGAIKDHEHGVHGTLAWTPELGGLVDGFWPAKTRIVPLATENLLAFQRTALAGGAFVHALTAEIAGGNGLYGPGDTLELHVLARNSGVRATTGPVAVRLVLPSGLVPVVPEVDLGVLAPFSQAGGAGQPLVLRVGPTSASFASLALAIELEYEGFTQTVFAGSIEVGKPVPLVADALEIDLGWTAGIPTDTASDGQWQLGDPNGKSYLGKALAPEDDATPAGTLCFATEIGPTLAAAGDVDGVTTLVSPPFDLSLGGTAFVSYARWFASLGSSAGGMLEVELSNDGGATWTLLEQVTDSAGLWTTATFAVEDFVAPTADMRVRFVAQDAPASSFTEAAIDDFAVLLLHGLPRFTVYGKPELGAPVALDVTGEAGDGFLLALAAAPADLPVPGIQGESLLLDPASTHVLLFGTIPPGQLAQTLLALPDAAELAGVTVYLQAVVFDPGGVFLTNGDELQVE